jgi:hypothetical protein
VYASVRYASHVQYMVVFCALCLASTDAVRVSPNPVPAACVRGVLAYLSDRDVCGRVCCGDLLCVCGLLWFFLLSLP